MKAIVYKNYGSPDVLHLEEIEKPSPGDDEVLIKIQAASVNPFDWHHLRGTPFPFRLSIGLLKPKHKVLGADIAGAVEAVGKNVNLFQPGDKVYGDCGLGGFAEYVCAKENTMALMPTNLSFEEAASVPMAALTALQCLRDEGKIQSGQKVLINGASGGVGTFAVQVAKSFGAEVTGVCSTRNIEQTYSLGADRVIDYTKENFTLSGLKYDLILDNVGNLGATDFKRTLNPEGTGVIAGFSSLSSMFRLMILGPWMSVIGSQKIGLMESNTNTKDLIFLNELIEAGKVEPVMDRTFPLSKIPDALRYLEKGHARGKVVIDVEDKN